MTDGLSMQKCPKCGKENLAYMTHCVHCGTALEAMFSFDGQVDLPENTPEEDVATLPFILEEMQSAPQLIEDDTTDKDEDNSETQETDSDTPEWLKRVRQRAQAEEDATGRLTKSLNTMQERLEDDTKSDAESQYQVWLDDLREKAELKKAKQADDGKAYRLYDGGGMHLRITAKGTKTWFLEYTHPITGKKNQ